MLLGWIYFATLCSLIDSYNILVYSPAFSNSHSYFMGKLADSLTDAGHNVTLLVTIIDHHKRNITGVKSTKDVVFVDKDPILEKNIMYVDGIMKSFWTDKFIPEDYQQTYSFFHNNFVETCANLFRNTEIFEEMKSRNFDVIINEPVSICSLGFAWKLGIRKMIQAPSCTMYEYLNEFVGEPDENSYVPSILTDSDDNMNIFERYENFKSTYYSKKGFIDAFDAEETIYKKNSEDEIPSWRELLASSSAHFANSNPYLDFPRATIQKTVQIGGISVNMSHIRSQKLDDEWDEILKLRNKTMLISFGTLIQSKDMPIKFRETLLRTVQSFPDVTFIWKYELDDTKWAEHVSNVHFSKWVPQIALLNDKRVTAFLTHGGLGSTNELAYCGKPALTIGIFWDQARNGKMLEKLGTSITIKKSDLGNYDLVRKSVHDILLDDSYTRNAQRIAAILEKQPIKPKDLVVKYIEFVAEFGPFPNMDPQVRHLNFIQRTGLDVIAIFYASQIIVLILFIFIILLFFKHLKLSIRHKKIE